LSHTFLRPPASPALFLLLAAPAGIGSSPASAATPAAMAQSAVRASSLYTRTAAMKKAGEKTSQAVGLLTEID
jgi:hypothetical protein